jgi:precorrin-3B C17-methyltransferase
VEIEIIPGVSAMLSGAAVLGAPLTHDFAVISLSDLLTPWATIEKRLVCAAQADFVICLYNPASHRRKDHLRQACDIILQYASPETVCGLVRNIGREGESCRILALRELREAEADMFTTVFIGSSRTRIIGGRMVTPRGYRI